MQWHNQGWATGAQALVLSKKRHQSGGRETQGSGLLEHCRVRSSQSVLPHGKLAALRGGVRYHCQEPD